MSWPLGVIVGKFLPPHRGHHFLIDTALEECERLVVFVRERPDDPIPAALRLSWLRERHPQAEFRHVDDRYDPHDSALWAGLVHEWLGERPGVVFTSESYGEAFARHLHAHHVCVDPRRQTVPISGSEVRADPYANWRHLEAGACGWHAKRVVVLGAESTGTTTLARALAATLGTVWVAEYGREYTYRRPPNSPWRSEEFTDIAREQNARENAAARRANRVLVCDTDAFATNVWHRRYLGRGSAEVLRIAAERRADLYLLTGDEIPFVQDGVRDGEHLRSAMHGWFEEALAAQPVPWRVIRGTPSARTVNALAEIDLLFAGSSWRMPARFRYAPGIVIQP